MRKKNNKKSSLSTLRIIAGRWGGRKLSFMSAEGLRPSGNRVRERVFNWLMHDVEDARCLDLFAGSGALGLEALSRGASYVSFVDNNKATTQQIQLNLDNLSAEPQRVSVHHSGANNYLQKLGPEDAFDIIFLDPPFGKNLLPDTFDHIKIHKALKPRGLVYIELENNAAAFEALAEGLDIMKDKSSGQARSLLVEVKGT